MKQHTKWFATALAVAGGLVIANSVQAQGFTSTTISDFQNFNLSAAYANWNPTQSQAINGGSGFTPVITSGSTPGSFEVEAEQYGSGAYNLPTAINAPGATEVSLTFTINTPANGDQFLGPNFDLTDGTHQVQYAEYAHYITPGTFTVTAPLAGIDPTDIIAFNLEFDPAGFGGSSPYDITYNNLSVLTPVPEPTTLALFAIGAAGLVIARRRVKVS